MWGQSHDRSGTLRIHLLYASVPGSNTLLRRDQKGLVTYHFESLPVDCLVHAVFTRLGGVSAAPWAALNVGHTVGDDPQAVTENHNRIYVHLDLGAGQVVTPNQVHGNHVARAGTDEGGQTIAATDGLVTNTPGLGLLLRFADCQPILLYDPIRHALGLIHAGWRGVAQAIARRAVEAMQAQFGSRPRDLLAGLGPAIGPCCYTVGENVAAAMGYVLPDWEKALEAEGEGQTWKLNLSEANAQLLKAAGVRKIEQAGLCTSCHTDEFYSHRAEQGQTGRFAAVAYLLPRDAPGGRWEAESLSAETDTDDLRAYSLNPPGFPGFGESSGGRQ